MPSVTAISAPPTFVSPEEHQQLVASTPDSFSDIPAVLRHQQPDVAVTLDPPLEGFSPQDAANGVLTLAFVSSTGKGFEIQYPSITLHAISRAESGPSIYCQLDETDENQHPPANDDEGFSAMRELNIIPQDPNSLGDIFEAMSLCASLHPDPNMSDEDEDDAFISSDGNFETFTGGEGEELIFFYPKAALQHLESIIYNPFERTDGVNGHADEPESHDPHSE
ncbi:hypothetical protein CONPUDRAFT_151209 [Coniophora puteana RWD-64-598 SS2]|uniref:Uncharacterized protein n=1 Tax=Coniophora puteana (strain RWD-64-598) TaxID=741705 RepID=A0A5M3MZE2_CONPW|nr:uncharacterized protein CONPUDRAFT_151209 [Coniophora puteana RWD-64-598 SS2]EIW84174.1 hypothetical protein CONPUDRAFT_151209 [Coniophora puteana RWD-64-598 SS2]